ncbi:hypothetical protein HYV43_02700 [Candidatus Micrarchaeota archaeon]|nr:hypothetical protein [Candidatus Micrarchaeota archaeon]
MKAKGKKLKATPTRFWTKKRIAGLKKLLRLNKEIGYGTEEELRKVLSRPKKSPQTSIKRKK